ncbi:KdsC family phosphatase [Nitrococcus mobilis]|uniref:3-deoxy-D-manno-octulosonate 8-phosphate phosphatase KdsC n=1 Tax=Nitrococcus mobilis Nb-231 TaxID=314278 RepID=A4BQL7_9GAMM|nr:HAD hydrolase family protein [Nitrococcus mobilis]EAR21867.1 hydrolase, HAD-superfamily, subfamily IIIA [Nitrococcus mobilis Nb-231]
MAAFADAYCARPSAEVIARAARVRLLTLDVDGVLTDGTLYIGQHGEAIKPFHTHDGQGIKMAITSGIEVAMLSARCCATVARRARELGVRHVVQGAQDKRLALSALCEGLKLTTLECAYVGDDIVDLGAVRMAGLGIAVAGAHPRIATACHWQTHRRGGHGAVREVCELLLAARERLQDLLEQHG